MRLKSLNIKGFKSFANETVIHINERVTGVVGPNGAGKSNIVDAIRWVLGEQKSRELRLEQMSDVLFNGAKSKKQSGLAQVSLTFENTKNVLPTEYQTVTISRLLYRSGESEYRLNGVTCRLKDIRSLFLDTGIGSNSYAIIALGMVDDILADKERARRRMFEQAAGISKYKNRKRETLNKLQITTQDLERVEDLLFELENNMKALEKQAKRTQKYFDLKQKYQALSVQLALRTIDKHRQRVDTINAQVESETLTYRTLETRLRQEEANLQDEKKKALDKEKDLSSFQKSLNDRMNDVRNLENEKGLLAERASYVERRLQQVDQQNELDAAAIVDLKRQLDSLEDKRISLDQAEQHLQNLVRDQEVLFVERRTEHGDVKSVLDQALSHQHQLEQQIFDVQKDLAVNENQQNSYASDIERFEQEVQTNHRDFKQLKQTVVELEKRASEKEASIRQLQGAENERKQRAETTRASLVKTKETLARVHRQVDAAQNERDLLKSLIDSMEGFPESIRFLHREWNENVPILADLITADPKVQGVIEQYLEPYLNHFVVQKLSDAVQAIALLTESQRGKASFFVLDQFESAAMDSEAVAGLQRAIDVVQVQEPYRVLLDHLLHNVYIYDGALADLDEHRADRTVLSEKGHFIQRPFSLSGGSLGLFEGKKLGRKQTLERIEKRLATLLEKQESLSVEVADLESTLRHLEAEDQGVLIQQLKDELSVANEERIQKHERLQGLVQLESSVSERVHFNRKEIKRIEKLNGELRDRATHFRTELEQLKAQASAHDDRFAVMTEQLSNASEAYNNAKIDLIRHENERTALAKDVEFHNRRISELKGKTELALDERNKLEAELTAIGSRTSDMDDRLQRLYADRKDDEAQLSLFEQAYYDSRSAINEAEEELRQLNRQLSERQLRINELKEKRSHAQFGLRGLYDRMQIEFELTKKELEEVAIDEGLEYSDLEYKVERLKNRIANFGEINPLAVEAFEEIQKRHEAIRAQRDDVLEAKESLLETIREIEETATARFMESFNRIRENFRTVFRELFTEDDDCDLILVDPSVPLESGIEIIAKPKGKRPKSLSQLSGGEKTLTATALLFALYLLKPAPFCVFDEVDAPLDDSNVQKFNKIVQRFSGDSQFIIVTHNKATMAAVDVLYGVFMPEHGISAVSPVDFRTYEHEPTLQTVS